MKTCRECGKRLPLEDFYVHSKMADGRLNKCRNCVKARVAVHREANLDRVQAYDRSRSDLPHRIEARQKITANLQPEKIQEYHNRHHSRHPDKRNARTALGNAVRNGKITPSEQCETCGTRESLEGHHDDYAKPLEVRWLCVPCHAEHHKAERARKRAERAAA